MISLGNFGILENWLLMRGAHVELQEVVANEGNQLCTVLKKSLFLVFFGGNPIPYPIHDPIHDLICDPINDHAYDPIYL